MHSQEDLMLLISAYKQKAEDKGLIIDINGSILTVREPGQLTSTIGVYNWNSGVFKWFHKGEEVPDPLTGIQESLSRAPVAVGLSTTRKKLA
jgi:hypothetical protein